MSAYYYSTASSTATCFDSNYITYSTTTATATTTNYYYVTVRYVVPPEPDPKLDPNFGHLGGRDIGFGIEEAKPVTSNDGCWSTPAVLIRDKTRQFAVLARSLDL